MLLGQYEGKVAEKQQVALPKKFREELGDHLIIAKGFDGQLIIISTANWESLLGETEGKPFVSRSERETQRFLLGNATEIELDDKGRFVLPEYLRRHAGISKEVVFAGIKTFVEVWDKEAWEEVQKKLASDIQSISERLNKTE